MANSSTSKKDAWEEAIIHFYQTPTSSTMEQSWREAVRSEEAISMTQNKTPIFRTVTAIAATLVLVVGSLWAGTLDQVMGGTGIASDGVNYEANSIAPMPVNDQYRMTSESASGSSSGNTSKSMTNSVQTEQKLVRTANVRLATGAFEEASKQITLLIESMGGYAEDLSEYSGDGLGSVRSMNWSSRIPSDQLDDFLLALEGVAKVTSQSQSTQDQTLQFYDNEARLSTLEQKMTRLKELLEQAENVGDMIEIESEIADTQYQIDSYQTWQTTITRDMDMSSVFISLEETVAATTANASDEPLLKRIQAAFFYSMEWFADFFQNMVVFIVVALPALIVAAIVVIAGRILWKKRRG